MDKNQVLEKAIAYARLVSDKIKPEKIVLYGSYAKGNWKKESDINITVIVDKSDDDFLTTEAMLYKLRRSVDDRIETILFEKNSNQSGFLDEILMHGQVIYNASNTSDVNLP